MNVTLVISVCVRVYIHMYDHSGYVRKYYVAGPV